jgi:hypothetical protein
VCNVWLGWYITTERHLVLRCITHPVLSCPIPPCFPGNQVGVHSPRSKFFTFRRPRAYALSGRCRNHPTRFASALSMPHGTCSLAASSHTRCDHDHQAYGCCFHLKSPSVVRAKVSVRAHTNRGACIHQANERVQSRERTSLRACKKSRIADRNRIRPYAFTSVSLYHNFFVYR